MLSHQKMPISCRVVAEIAWNRTWQAMMARGERQDAARVTCFLAVLEEIERAKRPDYARHDAPRWSPSAQEADKFILEIWPLTLLDVLDGKDAMIEYACFREHEKPCDKLSLDFFFAKIFTTITRDQEMVATLGRIRPCGFAWNTLLPDIHGSVA